MSTAAPASAAMRAAETLVSAPPVPTPARPTEPISTPASASPNGTCGDALGAVEVRRPRVQRVDVGEQHEQVGADELGDEGGEPVVVAEADLVGRDRVVLVDDRQDAQREQAVHGALGVRARGRVLEVARGEQHLAGDDAVAVERVLVAEDEQVLADGCRGLLGREVGGPRVELAGTACPVAIAPEDTSTTSAPRPCAAARASTSGRDLAGVLAADRRGADLDDDAASRAGSRRALRGVTARPRRRSRRLGRRPSASASIGDVGVGLRRPRCRPRARAAARRGPRPWRPCARGTRSRRSARVARRFSSRRTSVPRGAVMSSAVEVSVGSQSKTTPVPGPMTTVEPATAPARTSSSSTPSLREAVGEEADGLVVREVGLLHPALGLRAEHAVERAVAAALGAHDEAGVVDGLRAHDDALAPRGRLRQRRAPASTSSPSAKPSWRRPSWLTVEISKTR